MSFTGLFGATREVEGAAVPLKRARLIRSWLTQARDLGYLVDLIDVHRDEWGNLRNPRIELRIEPHTRAHETIKLMADFEVDILETHTYVIEPKPYNIPMEYLENDGQISRFFGDLRKHMQAVAPDQVHMGAQAVFYYAHNWNHRFTFEQIVQMLPLLTGIPSFFKAVTHQPQPQPTFEALMAEYAPAMELMAKGIQGSMIVDLYYPKLQWYNATVPGLV